MAKSSDALIDMGPGANPRISHSGSLLFCFIQSNFSPGYGGWSQFQPNVKAAANREGWNERGGIHGVCFTGSKAREGVLQMEETWACV